MLKIASLKDFKLLLAVAISSIIILALIPFFFWNTSLTSPYLNILTTITSFIGFSFFIYATLWLSLIHISVTLRDGILETESHYLLDYLEKYCAEGSLKPECLDMLNYMFDIHYQDQHHFQCTRNPQEIQQAIRYCHVYKMCIRDSS